jgi:hypothetical protein
LVIAIANESRIDEQRSPMADFRHAIRRFAGARPSLPLLPCSDPDTLVVLTVPSARDVAGQMFLPARAHIASATCRHEP